MSKIKVSFTLDEEDIIILDKLSKELNISKSLIVSNALKFYKDSSIDNSKVYEIVKTSLQDNFKEIAKITLRDIHSKLKT